MAGVPGARPNLDLTGQPAVRVLLASTRTLSHQSIHPLIHRTIQLTATCRRRIARWNGWVIVTPIAIVARRCRARRWTLLPPSHVERRIQGVARFVSRATYTSREAATL